MEEAKTQENAKLQRALQELQQQFKETKLSLMKEQEAPKVLHEAVPVIKEIAVVDHEALSKFSSENEKLKVLMVDVSR